MTRLTWATLAAPLLVAPLAAPLVLDNGLARTPPMGWNTWNRFGCDVSEQLVQQTADAMVNSGMKSAGYQFLIVDDCWQVGRDSSGTLLADSARFPSGMKALAAYVHKKGLRFGIYTDAGSQTCEGRPGSLGHEQQDARTFASWGVDYVKEDWCHAEGLSAPVQYAKFRDAIRFSRRKMVFSICEWGSTRPWSWAPWIGNLWRTTGDIKDTWASMLSNLDANAQYADVAGPGAWNDPDMLEVGNGGMTDDEYRAHFSLWAIMAAPLIAGNDVRDMTAATREILTNREVIAVNQDELGTQGKRAAEIAPGLEIWARPLKGDGSAVVLFNRTEAEATIAVQWTQLGLSPGKAKVRDLWAHADRGEVAEGFSTTVPAHGVVMLRVTQPGGRK
jgi:alpha-galactosidase